MKKTLLILLSVLCSICASAQIEREVAKSVKVHFRQGVAVLDENYLDNKSTLRQFAAEVKAYYQDTTARFRQIRILSSVSPEGSKKANQRIAKQRAEAIIAWISREISVNLDYAVESMGIDWALLTKLIEQNDKVPYRDEVLDILQNTPDIIIQDGNEKNVRYEKLQQLRGGVPYKWIYNNLFPDLRYAAARCEFWWETIPKLIITSENPHRVDADGAVDVITYEHNVDNKATPSIRSTADWINNLIPTANNATFTVAPNPTSEPRSATIVMSCYGKTYEVAIEQEGATPSMVITSADSVSYAAEGGEGNIAFEKRVKDGIAPKVACEADWIENINSTADSITYTVAPNSSEEPRSTEIVVESYGQQHIVAVNQAGAQPECRRPFYMAVKTNMLYDLAAIPNIGAEFYLGGNFSLAANWHYSWWKSDKKYWYWRSYGGDIAVRYWLGKQSRIKPLTGHHLGLYGQMITYDFEVGNKGILADKWSWSAGLEYGYSLPVARRLNIDFTIGLGYHWGTFEEYLPIDGHYVWQATKRRQYIGPTKLEVSLVWLIGCGNYNKDKGGKK